MEIITNQPLEKCNYCYSDISAHINGPYCSTDCEGTDHWVACLGCLPVKLVLCFPCHLGVLINFCLNTCCNCSSTTNKNYLC